MVGLHERCLVSSTVLDRQRSAEEVAEVIDPGTAADALPVDDDDGLRVAGVEEQVVDAKVLMQQGPRPFGDLVHHPPEVGRDALAGFGPALGKRGCELGVETRPESRPHLGEALDACVHHAGYPLHRRCLDFAPPTRVKVGHSLHGVTGLQRTHSLHLIPHHEVTEVFHHDNELGRAAHDVSEEHPWCSHRRVGVELAHEADLRFVHTQAHALGAVFLERRRGLHDHTRRRRAAVTRVGQTDAGQFAHHTDPRTQRFDLDRGHRGRTRKGA